MPGCTHEPLCETMMLTFKQCFDLIPVLVMHSIGQQHVVDAKGATTPLKSHAWQGLQCAGIIWRGHGISLSISS